jgi:hypothetical protein
MHRIQLATALVCVGAAIMMMVYGSFIAALFFALASVGFAVAYYDQKPYAPPKRKASDD